MIMSGTNTETATRCHYIAHFVPRNWKHDIIQEYKSKQETPTQSSNEQDAKDAKSPYIQHHHGDQTSNGQSCESTSCYR